MYTFTELHDYWLKRSPTLFQQVKHPNLCATLLQKNDADRLQNRTQSSFDQLIRRLTDDRRIQSITKGPLDKDHLRNIKSVQQLTLDKVQIPNENDIIRMPEISPTDALGFEVEKIKQCIETGLQTEQKLNAELNALKASNATAKETLVELGSEKKIKERTHILIENPAVNMEKMNEVLKTSEARLSNLAVQWEAHRAELIKELELANGSTSSQNVNKTKRIL